LNLRPLDPQSSALPSCATPRQLLIEMMLFYYLIILMQGTIKVNAEAYEKKKYKLDFEVAEKLAEI
jgi:hypothetical protein